MESIWPHAWTALVTLATSAVVWAGVDAILKRRQEGRRMVSEDKREDDETVAVRLHEIIDMQNIRIEKQEAEILRLRDSEQAVRNENSIKDGRIILLEGRNRDQWKRILRYEAKLKKLGVEGSWEEKEEHKKAVVAHNTQAIEDTPPGGTPNGSQDTAD
jgi:hypothetical protein